MDICYKNWNEFAFLLYKYIDHKIYGADTEMEHLLISISVY